MSIAISRNNGELRIDETIGTFADLDRLVFALYHAGFLLWPKEITALAEAGKIGGEPPATMRAALTIGTAKSDVPANAPEKPAGAPLRAALPQPPAPAKNAAPATGRGGKPQPIMVDGKPFETKTAAIFHCFRRGGRTDSEIAAVCSTTVGTVYSSKRDFREAERRATID